jgi:serine/threonine-protein kinase HipA
MSRSLNVYLFGRKAGVLTEDEQSRLSFRYEPDAQAPLSVRMPVRTEEYLHDHAYPFFENLIPEGSPLEIIADRMHIPENNPFSVLDKIGGDCAGAVALYEGEIPDRLHEPLREITGAEMARIIDTLPENPLLTSMDNPPRLSLAGAQFKFAVCAGTGAIAPAEALYFCPNEDYPSTTIIKIEHKVYKNLLHNELFCMMLGRSLGLNIPQIRLCETEGRLFLDIARYDREPEPVNHDRIIKSARIHQEDFCQALGRPSGRKYQADGGPGLRNCYQAIMQYSSSKVADAFSFLQWTAFNYLIGNADAHAKNLSFLHKNGRITLAPFYDLLSTEIYPEKLSSRKIAMLINGKDQYEKMRHKDFLALYEQLDLNPSQTMKNIAHFFAKAAEKTDSLRNQLNSGKLTASPVYDDIVGLIKKRLSVFE